MTLDLGKIPPTRDKWIKWLHRAATTILAILQALQIGGIT